MSKDWVDYELEKAYEELSAIRFRITKLHELQALRAQERSGVTVTRKPKFDLVELPQKPAPKK